MSTRLLVRLPNWLGDIVMAMPALAAVRTRWPEAHLSVAMPRAFAPLGPLGTGVDAVVPLKPARGWGDGGAFAGDVAALRAAQADIAVLFTNSLASARMARMAGIPERWGYRHDLRTPLLTRAVPKPRHHSGAARHHARYYGWLVERLGCAPPEYRVRLEPPAAWRDAASRLLTEQGVDDTVRLVAFAPGAAYGTAKQWPPRLVAEVIAHCLREHDVVCVLLGSTGDASVGATIHALVARELGEPPPGAVEPGAGGGPVAVAARGGRRLLNLIGRTDLPTLAGVLARCVAFVCNDSGPMHLGSALGVHTIATFGATDEEATAPLGPHTIVAGDAWCRPCLKRECPLDHRCMWSIPAARVAASVFGLLS